MIQFGYSYDPGATTGYANFKLDTTTREITVVSTGTFKDYATYGKHLTPGRLVIYEIVRACTKGFNPAGILSTGALLYVAEVLGIQAIGQYPHGLKGPRLWIKEANLKFPSEHEKDATAHVLLYCINNKYKFRVG